jgi:hypothetical protein
VSSTLSRAPARRGRRIPGRLGGHVLAVVVVASATAAGASDAPVPWPGGSPPDDETLTAQIDEAVRVGRRELADEAVAAIEPAEDREHITVFQDTIDGSNIPNTDLFLRGDAFFSHAFSSADGYGDGPNRRLRRVHTGVRGGLDSHSCDGCHFVGGLDGAGSETQRAFLEGDGDRTSSAVVRSPPQIIGLGFVQALGLEMTRDLTAARDRAVAEAAQQGTTVEVELVSKGVHFGTLTASENGDVDTGGVEGVSPDLVVRPFGWKGDVARLRRFAEDAARVHFGVQSTVLASGYETKPDEPHLGAGPNWFDPDGDGVSREIEEGILTSSAVYMSMLESPVILPPADAGLRERWARGSGQFDAVGCASCHVRELPTFLNDWVEMPDTTTGAGVDVKFLLEGDHPKSGPSVKLFSDLKRHDMGEGLADPHDTSDGVPRSVFLTRPLWGLAETAPYMHDGRAATIPEAILAHGGEAASARDAFAALPEDAKIDLHVFLLSLTRAQKVRLVR